MCKREKNKTTTITASEIFYNSGFESLKKTTNGVVTIGISAWKTICTRRVPTETDLIVAAFL